MRHIPIRCFFSLILLAWLIIPSIALAAEVPTWEITPNASTITFTAMQNNAPVSGTFDIFSGDIHFAPEDLNASHVMITVKTGSVHTSYGEVADTLKTADWFSSKLFPDAVFKASQFIKTGNNTYQGEGTLTLRDKTLPVTLTFIIEKYTATAAKVKGSTVLKRVAFGIGQGEWAKTDEVKDDVQVNFSLELKRKT